MTSAVETRARAATAPDATPAALPAPLTTEGVGASFWTSTPFLAATVGAIVAAAWSIRLAPLAGDTFPVNDGGLFAMMIDEIRANAFRLPSTTAYNQLDIPFAYPPLGLYIAAIVGAVTGSTSTEVLRWLPGTFSVATVFAFFFLARRLSGSIGVALFATAAFAILPRSYLWMVMGGGITRSVGYLFAVLALIQFHELYDRGGRRPLVLAAVFAAAALLSHLEGGWLVVYSAIPLWAAGKRPLVPGARDTVLIGALGAVITAPWWGTIALRHGVEPFLGALGSGEHFSVGLATVTRFAFTGTPGFDLIAVLGLAGVFRAVRTRQFFLPGWLLLIFLFDPRAGASYAMMPLAILAAHGFFDLVRGQTFRVPQRATSEGATATLDAPETPAVPAAIAERWPFSTLPLDRLPPLTAILAVAALWLASGLSSSVAEKDPLLILTPEDRQAMEWARTSTPRDAEFLVLSTADGWWSDIQGEWFPALSERRSVATPQGREWLPAGDFDEAVIRHSEVQWCGWYDVVCTVEWSAAYNQSFDFVYVPVASPEAYEVARRAPVPACCDALFESMMRSDGFRLRYRNDRVAIFEMLDDPVPGRLAVRQLPESEDNASLEGGSAVRAIGHVGYVEDARRALTTPS